MASNEPVRDPFERWPGFNEQSRQQRYMELDRRHSAFVAKAAEHLARHCTLSQADGQKLLERYGKALMADMTQALRVCGAGHLAAKLEQVAAIKAKALAAQVLTEVHQEKNDG